MAQEQSARLFIGLEPDDAARQALERWAEELKKRLGGRFYRPDMYHVTLAFLGQVERERIPLLTHFMQRCALPPFEVSVDRLDAFKQGKILFAGVSACPELMRLQENLAARLRGEGFALEDAPYVPHITLARQGSGFEQPLSAPEIRFTAAAVTLFESTRVQDRLCYLPLARVRLSAGRNADAAL